MTVKRSLQELLAVDEPAWQIVQNWVQSAANAVEVLQPAPNLRGQALEEIQVTVRSPMGAVVYETGGILVDHGWLRVLGSGHPKLRRSLPEWNRRRSISADGNERRLLLVADDAVGGFYALNAGAFGPEAGQVFYFAPDSLRWGSLNGMGYGQFLAWALSDKLSLFYRLMRWDGWESEVTSVGGDSAFSIYPPLCSKEGKDISKCSRKPCPIEEVYQLNVVDFPAQLASERS